MYLLIKFEKGSLLSSKGVDKHLHSGILKFFAISATFLLLTYFLFLFFNFCYFSPILMRKPLCISIILFLVIAFSERKDFTVLFYFILNSFLSMTSFVNMHIKFSFSFLRERCTSLHVNLLPNFYKFFS